MKKILLVINTLNLGGIEKATVNLLKSVQKPNWEIELLLVKKDGVFLRDVPENITVNEISMPEIIRDIILKPTMEIIKKYIKKREYRNALKVLWLYIRRYGKDMDGNMNIFFREYDRLVPVLKNEYDVAIDYQGQGSFPTYFVAKKVCAKKKLSWIHSDYAVVNDSIEWLKKVYSSYDKVVSVSQKAKRSFLGKFPEYEAIADVCNNIVSKDEITELSKGFCIVSKGKMSITTVGRLSWEKGYDIALNAMARLRDKGIDFTYHIVGEGEARTQIEKQIQNMGLEEYVFLAGFQKNPYPYIAACDLYLQPSRFEGFCITLTEAKILHKPIVTTDFAGADEQIRDGKTGLIVKCDEESIYHAIDRLLTIDGLKERFKENLLKEEIGKESIEKFYKLVCEG